MQRVGGLEFWDGWAGGNCGEVSSSDGKEFEIKLRPDAGSPRHRLWFHFRVRGATRVGQRVILSIVNMSKQRSLFKDAGMSAATRRTEGAGEGSAPFLWGAWGRVPPKDCYFYRSQRHRGAWKLSFVVTFETDSEEREFAYSFPYPYGEGLLPWLSELERGCLPFFRRDQLCLTPLGNRADLVTIADPLPDWSRPPLRGGRARPRPVIFVTARVHPGETPASHVTHGLMEFLLSDDPDAKLLRRQAVFVFVPMLNPDGVEAGNYRTDGNGSDLNRMWQNPSPEEEPTLWHTKQTVLEIARNENFSLDFFIDVHSHSTSRRSFMFYNPVHPSKILAYSQMEHILRLPKMLAKNMPDEFSMAACRCESEASKAGCARQVFGREAPNALSYTFEVSFFHAPDVAEAGEAVDWGAAQQPAPHTELNSLQNYSEMGAKIGRSFFDFYEHSRPKNEAPRSRDARWNSSTRTQDLTSARRNSYGGSGSNISCRGGGGLLQERAAGAAAGGRFPASELDFTTPSPSGAAARPPRSPTKGGSLSPNSPPFAGGGALRQCLSEVQMTFEHRARARRPRRTPSLEEVGRAASRRTAGARGWGTEETEEAQTAELQKARSFAASHRQAAAVGSGRAPSTMIKRKKAVAERPRVADMTVASSRQGPRDTSKGGAVGRGVQLPRVKKSKPLVAPNGASGRAPPAGSTPTTSA